LKPYVQFGFKYDDVKEVYKRGVRDFVARPRDSMSKLAFGLGRVSAYLMHESPKDSDLYPDTEKKK